MRQPMTVRHVRFGGGFALALALLAGCSLPVKTVPHQPAPTAYYTVPVQKGEPLKGIAARWQVREDDLLAVNNLYDHNGTARGDTIRVPAYGRMRETSTSPKQVADTAPREAVSAPTRVIPREAAIEKTPIPELKSASQRAPAESWLSWMMS